MEKSRKHQLINSVKNFLANNGGDYAFSKNPRMNQFNAYCFGEIRRETLLGLILTNNGIEVTTDYKGERLVCDISEFSNDEIVSIMEVAGIDIPAKKVEENPENPCIIGIFVVSL